LRTALLTLLLVTSALAGCIGAEDGVETASGPDAPEDATDPGDVTSFTKVHTPEEIAQIVTGYDDHPDVDVQRIGTSLEGRPIHLATVGDGPLELWVVGRQHGDEPTGGEAILLSIQALADPGAALPDDAPQVVDVLRQHREAILDDLTFHLVPVANPDGAAAYQRFTATGTDPNRDHFLFTHPFSRALREAFWERKPDACLDLHNEGTGETDYDAFGPEGPMPEDEPFARMLRDANLTVREVDAAGGNAGSYNENYHAPAPADDQPWPTAFHPGTHDMFCTARGAPGWTPEGAIEGGSNGATDPIFAWSTRLHQVTVAASALHWAGAYDATEPHVTKASGVLDRPVEHEVEVEEAGEATFQAVWRQTDAGGDHNPAPVRFTVTTPDGETLEGRPPHPEAWTSTVALDEAEPGTYTLRLQGAPGAEYELRTYTRPQRPDLVEVERTGEGLHLEAASSAPGDVRVRVSDVFDPADVAPSDYDPAPTDLHPTDGTATERLVAEWDRTLAPGDEVTIGEPDALEGQGPYRYTAAAGDRLDAGVEAAFNPAPD
jgi:hypothetical protein